MIGSIAASFTGFLRSRSATWRSTRAVVLFQRPLRFADRRVGTERRHVRFGGPGRQLCDTPQRLAQQRHAAGIVGRQDVGLARARQHVCQTVGHTDVETVGFPEGLAQRQRLLEVAHPFEVLLLPRRGTRRACSGRRNNRVSPTHHDCRPRPARHPAGRPCCACARNRVESSSLKWPASYLWQSATLRFLSVSAGRASSRAWNILQGALHVREARWRGLGPVVVASTKRSSSRPGRGGSLLRPVRPAAGPPTCASPRRASPRPGHAARCPLRRLRKGG